jgi:hypothetical protein
MKDWFIAIVLWGVIGSSVFGQSAIVLRPDTSLYVYGMILDDRSTDSLPDARITIHDLRQGKPSIELHANGEGKYQFYLGRNARYRVEYTRFDRVAKQVEIDAASVPDTSWHGGMAMEINITLPKPFPGSDDPLFHEPIGISRYNPSTNLLEWDLNYTSRLKEKWEARRASSK